MTRFLPGRILVPSVAVILISLTASASGQSPIPPSSEAPRLQLSIPAELGWLGREESGRGKGLSQRPVVERWARLEPTISINGFRLSALLYATSLEDALAQARNRLKLELRGQRAGILYGDHSNSASQLVANGAFIRGASGYVFPTDEVQINADYGRTVRATEGDYDSLQSRATRFGTFERRVFNANMQVRRTRGISFTASVASGEDRIGSIAVGRQPKENRVYGGELGYKWPGGLSEMTFSLGLSEIKTLATDFDSTRTDGETELAWRADWKTTRGVHRFAAAYYRIATLYESFAAPSVTPDREGLVARDVVNLFRGRLNLTLGFERFHDNVNNGNAYTLTINQPTAQAVIALGVGVPTLRLDGRYRAAGNDAPDSSGRTIDDALIETRAELSHRFRRDNGHWIAPSLSAARYDQQNQVRPAAEFVRHTFSGRVSGQWDRYSPNFTLIKTVTDFESGQAAAHQWSVSSDHGVRLSPRLETILSQRYTADRSNSRTLSERWELAVDAMLRFGLSPLTLRASYRYIDFSSTVSPAQDFHANELRVTVTASDLANLIPPSTK